MTRTAWQREQTFRAVVDREAREEWRREVERNRAEEDERERMLNEGTARIGGHALTAREDERERIAEDGAAFARERDLERLRECA